MAKKGFLLILLALIIFIFIGCAGEQKSLDEKGVYEQSVSVKASIAASISLKYIQ